MKKKNKAAHTKGIKSFGGKAIIFTTVVALICLPILLTQASDGNASVIPASSYAVTKSDLSSMVSVSGVVESINAANIYSTQTSPVKDIYVEVGDKVKIGDVLAQLDMSRTENEMAQATLNLSNAKVSATEEIRNNANSVTNAMTSLEASQIALERQAENTRNAEKDWHEAKEEMEKPFDSYTYDKVIDDTRTTFERRTKDYETAKADLDEAMQDFDDYAFVNAINEASITMERKLADLNEAEEELEKERNKRADAFDDTKYKRAVEDAEKNLQRRKDEEQAAHNNYGSALNDYYYATPETQTTAQAGVEKAETTIASSQNAIEDAQLALKRAKDDLTKARKDHNSNQNDYRDDVITAAEKSVERTQKAADDAQRTYDKALSDLERAKADAIKNTGDALIRAQDQLSDAKLAYERALNDKERAIQDYMDANETRLENAQKTLTDNQKQLKTAQNSVASANNSLSQARSKPETAGTSIGVQELNVEKLNEQLAEGKIIATANGVVTLVNASVGAVPNGVLFVIEDVENLYVSANVKEYNLLSIDVGQPVTVTTDATGDKVYHGEVTYISPRAVSQAGSTSVEFELKANLNGNDTAIKIGMNAYLNIITDTKFNIFTAPLSAIITDENNRFVLTMENEKIPVEIGLTTSTQAEISGSGLYDGMLIQTRPGVTAESPKRTGFGGGF